jgi:hypothetical protein
MLSFFKKRETALDAPNKYAAPPTYQQDGLTSIHNADFMSNARFKSAFDRAVQGDRYLAIHWRIHILTWAATTAMKIPGDFIECGVNRGFFSSAIMQFLDWNKTHGSRRYYLMDTFKGLSPELLNDREKAIGRLEEFKDAYPECYELTKKNFEEFEDVVLVRGIIPDTLKEVPSTQVAFMDIDMNCAAPEIAAMRYFWPKFAKGGIVVLDDYAYHGYQPQKDAMDALGEELGFVVASLPTGQGLIVK